MTTEDRPGVRARNRAAIESELRSIGRRHLAEHGAAALSLRAVARDLGRAPSALYRYVRDRDDLLTLLIVDAYDELGDALDAAVTGHSSGSRAAFSAYAEALRAWAVAHPSEYALLYGSPVPGYHAPSEATTRAGTRPIMTLVAIVAPLESVPTPPGSDDAVARAAVDALGAAADDPAVAATGLTATVLTRAISVWNLLLGSISSEVFSHLGTLTDRPDLAYAGVVDLAAALLFGGPETGQRDR